MTATTGLRQRNVPARPSTPMGQTQAAAAPQAPVWPITNGGTGKTTAPEAAVALGVPSLSADNAFTGANTFGGSSEFNAAASFQSSATFDGAVSVTTGAFEATGDPSTISALTVTSTLGVSQVAALSGLDLGYVEKTGNYTVDSTPTDCIVNVTANSPTITLPTAVGIAGRTFIIKNSGAGTVTLATTSSQTIDGAAPGTIAAGNSLTLVSTNANWIIV